MTDRLGVHTDGVLNSAELHSQVGSGLSGLTAAERSGVQNSHGTIASAVSGALGTVLGGRGDTIGVTSTSASTIADLLQKSATAYAAGDEEGGSRLKAAADALEGKGEPGFEAHTPATAAAGGAPGADPMGPLGQVMGQVGQLGGALAQSVTAPLQGLAQGLQQVPQQIMQGIQQAAQAAQSAELDAADEVDEKTETKPETDDETDPREKAEPAPVRDAQAGQGSTAGTAPVAAPPAPQPAPTRPQID